MVTSTTVATSDYVALEVEFRENVHSIQVEIGSSSDRSDEPPPTYAEFARQVGVPLRAHMCGTVGPPRQCCGRASTVPR